MNKGKLYLIPIPLGSEENETLPDALIQRIHALDIFIVERARTARRFVSSTKPPKTIQEITFHELDKYNPVENINQFLADAEAGKDIGLMSEAGCPGVADPGAKVVELAHKKGIQVIPLVGPSSILLALMASGMSGQKFCFHGYLPVKNPERSKTIKLLESQSAKQNQTQIFIETPYRNNVFLKDLMQTLSANTRICVACDLTLATEYIKTLTAAEWKKEKQLPELHKRPAVFVIQA